GRSVDVLELGEHARLRVVVEVREAVIAGARRLRVRAEQLGPRLAPQLPAGPRLQRADVLVQGEDAALPVEQVECLGSGHAANLPIDFQAAGPGESADHNRPEGVAGMAWNLSGRYVETCSCELMCPCNLSFDHGATYDYCRVTLVFSVRNGQIDGTDIGGLTVAMIADTPKVMTEGNWRLGVFIDEKASEEQFDKLA